MRIVFTANCFLLICFLMLYGGSGAFCADIESNDTVKVTAIEISGEHKEVGLERLKLLEKVLSQELLDKKLKIIHDLEAEYNTKALELINSIIPPVFNNKVISHVTVNFFTEDFENQLKVNQSVSLSVILRQGGFARWKKRYASEEEALSAFKKIISDTLQIPETKVSIVLTD